MNINPILNPRPSTGHTGPTTPTARGAGKSNVTTSIGQPTGDHKDGDIWNEVDRDGSCVIAVYRWSTSKNGWLQIKP